ncbi:MAG: nucleotidyl transferase AbiEii/AbiGii toxin family protein [Patescibacteria group bacterium]|nr:nucleotidyl transferase AbiEii/AbiGii toxin family protein [Patescibacteria group bacterium]
MDTPPANSLNLHLDILPPKTKKAFEFLSGQEWLGKSRWYLAGGTALALQVGHRRSVDLDFFTEDKDFDNDRLLEHFSSAPDWQTDINKEGTVYGTLMGAKISFIAYPFFIPAEKPLASGSIRMLTPADIAVMKIVAISQRGRKRDFVDLYWLVHHGHDLEGVIRKLKGQYPSVAHDYHHILKSLVYFEDAEADPMPELYFSVIWKEVKDFFAKEVPKITKRVVDL